MSCTRDKCLEMWILILAVGLTNCVHGQAIYGGSGPYTTYYTDSCHETGRKAIACQEGYELEIKDVKCMPHNFTCPQYGTIASLCNGLRSCANVDIRRQLITHCKVYPTKSVHTFFQCIPTSKKPMCRTNVCSDNKNIRCRNGSVFHLLTARCRYFRQECPSEVFQSIYRLCEGQRSCSASLLRSMLPDGHCNSASRPNNVFVDYVCVDATKVSSQCTGTFTVTGIPFGILTSPGYPANPSGVNDGCYWAIYANASLGEEAHLVVHEAYSVEGKHMCDSQYLQVQYTLCDTYESTVDRFCDDNLTNVKIHSCGTIYVTHKPYEKGDTRGSRFLVSYQVTTRRYSLPTYVDFTSQCEEVDHMAISSRYTEVYTGITSTVTSPRYLPDKQTTTISPVLPEDQPINDSSVGGPATATIEEKTDAPREAADPWRFLTILRVVVVNIFLGLLIIAVIMAITFVCYRYIMLGRDKKAVASKSATTTTFDEKQATESQLLTPEGDNVNPAKFTDDPTTSPSCANDTVPLQHSNGITSPYETTIFHFNRSSHIDTDDETVTCDIEAGVSSFMSHPPLRRNNGVAGGKSQNAESAYSSFEEDNCDGGGNYSEINYLEMEFDDTSKHHNKFSECDDLKKDGRDGVDTISGNVGICENSGHGNRNPNTIHTTFDCNGEISNVIHNPEYAVISKVNPQQRKGHQFDPRNQNQNNTDCAHAHHDPRNIDCAHAHQRTGECARHRDARNAGNCSHHEHTVDLHGYEGNTNVPNNVPSNSRHIHVVPEEQSQCSAPSTPSSSATMHLIPEHKCLLHNIPPPPPPPTTRIPTDSDKHNNRRSWATIHAHV